MQRIVQDMKNVMQNVKPRTVQKSPYQDMSAYVPAQYREMDDDEYNDQDIQDGQPRYTFDQMLKSYGVTVTSSDDHYWRAFLRVVVYLGGISILLIMGYGNAMVFTGFGGWA